MLSLKFVLQQLVAIYSFILESMDASIIKACAICGGGQPMSGWLGQVPLCQLVSLLVPSSFDHLFCPLASVQNLLSHPLPATLPVLTPCPRPLFPFPCDPSTSPKPHLSPSTPTLAPPPWPSHLFQNPPASCTGCLWCAGRRGALLYGGSLHPLVP